MGVMLRLKSICSLVDMKKEAINENRRLEAYDDDDDSLK